MQGSNGSPAPVKIPGQREMPALQASTGLSPRRCHRDVLFRTISESTHSRREPAVFSFHNAVPDIQPPSFHQTRHALAVLHDDHDHSDTPYSIHGVCVCPLNPYRPISQILKLAIYCPFEALFGIMTNKRCAAPFHSKRHSLLRDQGGICCRQVQHDRRFLFLYHGLEPLWGCCVPSLLTGYHRKSAYHGPHRCRLVGPVPSLLLQRGRSRAATPP
ncbi:hypothetical protein BC834DRAFT_94473 [Gloeopeniophorella convolvens]|nr:hypothetical protein BC834DRAFT_94473 [Gloeopeniophorella convolvens]